MTKPKTTDTATRANGIGDLYLAFRRLEREWGDIHARDPHDPQVGYGRSGPLTVERDEVLRTLRAAADAVIDSEQ